MRNNQPVTNNEYVLSEKDFIVSKTDLKGRITYVNSDFTRVSGFSEEELIGEPHNIVRHPDMPPEAFDDLWNSLKAGRPWVGLVKNRCKNGDFYWVEAHAAPIWENGQLVGYISVRRKPAAKQVEAADGAYRAFREKRAGGLRILHGEVVSDGIFAKLKRKLADAPVAFRFLLPSVIGLLLVMSATVYVVGQQINQSLNAKAEQELKQEINLIRGLMESTLDAIEREAARLLDLYASRYPGQFSVEAGEGGVPVLKHNKQAVNGHHDEEDAFAKVSKGPTATLLVRRGDEFVRISTSQKNEKGERVIHTVLDKEGPATAKLLAGESYFGRTSSQGKERISALKPIKDEAGKVIGAFGVGYFITEEMKELRERVHAVKLGETGYAYAIDAQAGKKQGDLLIHPAKEGANIIDMKDASGREFIREMIERKDGLIAYPWKNAELGDTREREKVVAFTTLPKWNLLVGGGTYRDEFDQISNRLILTLSIACLIVAVLLGILVFVVSRRVLTQRLARVLEVLKALSTGNYDNHIKLADNDELGRVMQGLASMQTRMGFEVTEGKRQADETTRIKIGLDNVATNVRITDNEGRILYINNALKRTFENDLEAFRAADPGFDPTRVLGTNIGRFYADPQAAIQRLRNLTGSAETQMKLGSRIYNVVTTPVISDAGERLGSVGEWRDVTDQLTAQDRLTEVMRAAADGNFSVRLSLNSKDAFFAQVEQLINQLLTNSEAALGELSNVLSAISDGDLTVTIDADYKGIFGELKDNTNSTVSRLQDVIGQIKSAAEAINSAAQEIAAGNQDLSGRTEEQASSLEETSSSMEQLNATVRQNAENAQQARSLAAHSNTAAASGGDIVKRAVVTMTEIQKSSHRIAEIIGVIDGIAFQTNILALNAAVEAARAGELGRGFAVVATEVRNLASRSAAAAKEIRGLISESVEKVDSGVTQVNQAGSAMSEVVTSFEQLAELVTDISNASREQSAGIEQVTQAVSQMDEVTQQNAALVEEAAAAAESLEEQARVLADNVARFRISKQAVLAAPREASFAQKPQAPLRLSSGMQSKSARILPPKAMEDEWEEF